MPNKHKNKNAGSQQGGVGYNLNVSDNCKIGGLAEVSATSSCPPGIGPGAKSFTQAMYNTRQLGGGKRKSRTVKSRKTNCKKSLKRK